MANYCKKCLINIDENKEYCEICTGKVEREKKENKKGEII